MSELKLQYEGKSVQYDGKVKREYMPIYGDYIIKCRVYQIEGIPGYQVLYEDNELQFLLRKNIFLSEKDLKTTLEFYAENGLVTLIGKEGPCRKKTECTIKTGV